MRKGRSAKWLQTWSSPIERKVPINVVVADRIPIRMPASTRLCNRHPVETSATSSTTELFRRNDTSGKSHDQKRVAIATTTGCNAVFSTVRPVTTTTEICSDGGDSSTSHATASENTTAWTSNAIP